MIDTEFEGMGGCADAEALFRELPFIRRVRGYRLYDIRGKRYLDLYQEGGRAILGHRPDGLTAALKDAFGKGGLAAYPNVYERRLVKHLARLLPAFPEFRIYASLDRAVQAAAGSFGGEGRNRVGFRESLGHHSSWPVVFDPAVPELCSSGSFPVSFWRPFLGSGVADCADSTFEALIPILPFPGTIAPWVVAFRGGAAENAPPSDLVSPAALAGLVRTVCDLMAAMEETDPKLWAGRDYPGWRRLGPYIRATCPESRYPELFRRCLRSGVVLNPRYPGPSILPLEWSDGEQALFRRLVQEDADADT